jgi:hypothetical protein
VGLYEPAVQSKQSRRESWDETEVAASLLYFPMGQSWQSMTELRMSASERYFPMAQVEQEVDPVLGVDEPAEQEMQRDSES